MGLVEKWKNISFEFVLWMRDEELNKGRLLAKFHKNQQHWPKGIKHWTDNVICRGCSEGGPTDVGVCAQWFPPFTTAPSNTEIVCIWLRRAVLWMHRTYVRMEKICFVVHEDPLPFGTSYIQEDRV